MLLPLLMNVGMFTPATAAVAPDGVVRRRTEDVDERVVRHSGVAENHVLRYTAVTDDIVRRYNK